MFAIYPRVYKYYSVVSVKSWHDLSSAPVKVYRLPYVMCKYMYIHLYMPTI